MSNPSPDLVIGIDFGTTGTAVAYADPSENKVHHVTNWPEGFKNYNKVPSMVAFERRNLEAWGFGVMNLEPQSITNLNSYKLFKPLFNSPNSPDATEAKLCVCTFLKALHKHLQQELKGMLPEQTWDESKVKFLFSYPTTWDQETKDRFSTTIEEAGYKKWRDQASLLSLDEVEASTLHYFNGASEHTLPKPDDYILVADIGGGTSDVSINKVVDITGREARLLPMVADEGRYIGSTQIDDQFKDKLRPILMDSYRERLRDRIGGQQLDAVAETYVDAAVLHLEYNYTYVLQKHNYGQVEGRLQRPTFPLIFPDPFSTEGKAITPIQEAIHREGFFENAFNERCSKIWNQCKLQMEELEKMHGESSGQIVKHVVLAGGLGSSRYIMAKLSQEFAKYAETREASPPNVVQIRDAEIAVCQGLVHGELRNLHGDSIWVYPAAASYGIQKAGNKNDIKWFLRHGDELNVPYDITIERHVDIAQAKTLDLQLVKVMKPPPTGLIIKGADKEAWNQLAVPVGDMSQWVKDLLPSDLKARHRFSKKATLVIKAKLLRGLITLILEYGKRQLGEKLFILESWHKDPRICEKGKAAPKSKAWKFNMSTSDKIAAGSLGVAIIGGIIMAVNQFRKKPEPVQVSVIDQKPDTKDGQDGNLNVESQNDIGNSSAAYNGALRAVSGNQDMAAILLDWKANTEIADESDWTPLYVSSLYVTNAIVDLPLERKANPNSSTYCTLHSAAQPGHDLALAVTPLLQRGADPNIAAADGWTPLLWAVNQMTKPGNYGEAVLKALLDASLTDVNRVSTISSSNTSRLILAIKVRIQRAVQLFTDHGADIRIPVEHDGQRITPVVQSAACHSPEEVEILRHLLADASSKEKMAEDVSLAHIAALHGHSNSLRLVLEYGADANAADVEGRTPLHLAARHSHPECISLLLAHGADVKAKANDRSTPLHEAASNADEECVRLLLDAGADMLVRCDRGRMQSPIDIMREKLRMEEDEDVQERYLWILTIMIERLAERDPRVGEVSQDRREGWSIEALQQFCVPDEEERPRRPTVAELRERYEPKFSTEAGKH
ncbi:hypothetical protein H9Q74_005057 [Fusarium xylarioides]|nr:hypothetical protein H9Q74_005057 [Fusarium xylarioides]